MLTPVWCTDVSKCKLLWTNLSTLHRDQISPVEDGMKSVLPDSLQIFNAISRTPTSAIIQGIPSSSSVVWRPASSWTRANPGRASDPVSLLRGGHRRLRCRQCSPVDQGQRAATCIFFSCGKATNNSSEGESRSGGWPLTAFTCLYLKRLTSHAPFFGSFKTGCRTFLSKNKPCPLYLWGKPKEFFL